MRNIFTIMKTQGMKALLLALLLSAAGLANAQIRYDFEDGVLPEGWTYHNHFTSSWYVGEQDPEGSTSAYSGNYSLFIGGTNLYGRDYIVSPPIDFFGDPHNSLHFAWCTPSWESSQNDLTVYFGTDPNDPNEWIPLIDFNMMQSDGWTNADIELGNIYGTYYIIFFSHDNYGYCTALDEIEIYNYIILDDFVYAVNEDNVTATLLGCMGGSSVTGTLTIPETVNYDGRTFTVTRIGDFAFYGCSGLTGNLVIPNSVTYIGEGAFGDCTGFTGDLTIPNSVTKLGDYPFMDCSGFNGRLTIGNSLSKISFNAFYNCAGFTELVIGKAVNYIDMQAFSRCDGLTSIRVLPTTPPFLSDDAFNKYSIPVTVPYGTVNLYMTTPGWNLFTNFVEASNIISINEIYIDGFTPPVWGAHPDIELTVPSDAPYSVYRTAWGHNGIGMSVHSWTVFAEEGTYFMVVMLNPAEGYSFAENATVYFNGDASICNPANNELVFGGRFQTTTIDFELWDPEITSTITTDVLPTEGGTVIGGGPYHNGDVCTLTAIPSNGFEFVDWNDGSTENPRYLLVSGDAQYVANFKRTGVGEFDELALNIYPNPAKESVRIEGLEADSEAQIYNSLGMLVKTVTVVIEEEINVSDLKSGVYTIRCGKQSLHFVKM